MEGFAFVTPITGLNRPNTGKEEEENDDDVQITDGKKPLVRCRLT
jgi:hypothetical protein